jgi:hypothetical protein
MTVEIILSENKIHIDSNVVSVDLLNMYILLFILQFNIIVIKEQTMQENIRTEE